MEEAIDIIDYYSQPGKAEDYFDYVIYEAGCVSATLIERMIKKFFSKDLQPNGGLLVDLGCGPGTSFPPLVDAFNFDKVLAVDGCAAMISFIDENFNKTFDLSLQVADIRTERIATEDESAELVTSCFTMSYLNNIDNVFKEATRILKKKGFFGFDITSYEEDRPEDVVHFMGDTINTYHYVFARKKILSLAKENNLDLVADFGHEFKGKGCPVPAKLGLFLFQKK